MAKINKYVGARYVPLHAGEWDKARTYEPLTVVTFAGASYTSKTFVPKNVNITDLRYWACTGNYNAQVEQYRQEIAQAVNDVNTSIGTVTGDITQQGEDIVAINEKMNLVNIAYFKNKRICIVGDSISSNTTYPPNWVEHFKTLVEPLGATVNNISTDGASLLGFFNEITLIPQGYDIYIIALGVNDFQGQFVLEDIRKAIYGILNRVQKDNNDVFYFSPIKTFRDVTATYYSPLALYREIYENLALEMGARVISGYNLPMLNAFTQSTLLADKLHPNATFAPYIANYIYNAILSKTSTLSRFNYFSKQCEMIIANGGGSCTIKVLPNARFTMLINLLNVNLTAGWNDICYVGDVAKAGGLLKDGALMCSPVNLNTSTFYQARITDNKLQLYTGSSETINPYMNLEFHLPVATMSN